MDEEIINRKVDRRRLLGRAGAVAATVAGAGAVSAAMASPAGANAGSPVIQGQDNDAGNSQTTLRNNATSPALVLGNSSIVTDTHGLQQAKPALQLTPAGQYALGPVGSLGVSTDGTLWTSLQTSGPSPENYADFIRTGGNSTIVRSFTPVRMLDTRPSEPGGKEGIINPSVIGPNGFVAAGQTIHINLDSLFVWAWTVFANITIVGGGVAGFATAFPTGKPRPNASNVNWPAGGIVANFAAISVGEVTDVAKNAISIFTLTSACIIVDVAGGVVNFPSDIKGASGGTGRAVAESERVRPAHLMPGFPT